MVEEGISDELMELIMREDYSNLSAKLDRSIRENGWEDTKSKFIVLLKNIFNNRWLAINWTLLRTIESDELLGYDGDILKILSEIDDIENIQEFRERIISDLIEKLFIQLKNGGPTLLFDIEKMKSKSSIILIPELILARQREVQSVILEMKQGSGLSLQSALRTTYGFEVILNEEEVDSLGFLEDRLSTLLEVYNSSFSLSTEPKITRGSMSERFALFHNAMVVLMVIYKNFLGKRKVYRTYLTRNFESRETVLYRDSEKGFKTKNVLINKILKQIIYHSPEDILENVLESLNILLNDLSDRHPQFILEDRASNVKIQDLDIILEQFELLRKETNKPLVSRIDAEREWRKKLWENDMKQFEEDERLRRQQVREVLDLVETRDYEKELSVFRDWMNKRKKNKEN